jgi:hypothetical protein
MCWLTLALLIRKCCLVSISVVGIVIGEIVVELDKLDNSCIAWGQKRIGFLLVYLGPFCDLEFFTLFDLESQGRFIKLKLFSFLLFTFSSSMFLNVKDSKYYTNTQIAHIKPIATSANTLARSTCGRWVWPILLYILESTLQHSSQHNCFNVF